MVIETVTIIFKFCDAGCIISNTKYISKKENKWYGIK